VIVPPTWNPDSRHLAYLDKKRLLLTVQLVTTGDMRQIILPASGAAEWWNRGLIWNPQGTALAIPLKDRGLWLLPSLAASTNLVQITPALPEIHSVRWSPDGSQIAFISGEDVYIVSVGGTP
jgi:Tol biopolymer transport system component